MANGRVVASGSVPSRSAQIGESLGGGFGVGLGAALGQSFAQRRQAKQLNPMREAFLQSIQGTDPSQMTPQQQMIAQAAQDPRMFAQLAGDAQGAVGLMQPFQPQQQEPDTFSRVVSGKDRLNELFQLGIPEDGHARVEFQRDPETGTLMLAGGVEGAFGAPQTSVSVSTSGETAFAQALGRQNAEEIAQLRDEARMARDRVASLQQARTALDSGAFTPGALGPTRASIARFGDLLGINLGLGDAATAEQLEAASSQLAVAAAERLSRVTNMSLGLAQNTVTSLGRTPEGNRLILTMLEREAEVTQQENRLVERMISDAQRRGEPVVFGDLAEARMRFRDENPIVTPELRDQMLGVAREGASRPGLGQLLGSARQQLRTLRTAGEVDRTPIDDLADFAAGLNEEQFNSLPEPVQRRMLERLQEAQGQ